MRTSLACAAALALATLAPACRTAPPSAPPSEQPPAPAPAPGEDLSAPGALLTVARFRPAPADPAAVGARASGLAEVLAGAKVPAVAPEAVAAALAAHPGHAELLAESDARVSVHVDAAWSELLVVHGRLADDYTAGEDVGAARARGVFQESARALLARRLVEPEGLALERVRTGRQLQAETARGGQPVVRIKEYLFEVPRVLGGVEVLDAGVTISVHRSGRLVSIRALGPLPVAAGTFRRTVGAPALAERAREENPGAEVVPVGLRYAWRAEPADAAVKPRQAFKVFPLAVVEGRTVRGRGHYALYAVDDPRAPPLLWPRPEPEATGDARK